MIDLNKELTLVTVTYNSAAVLPGHLTSLVNSASSALPRWLIVDNASSDGTDEILKEYANYVEMVKCETNLGFGAACNVGIAAASTPYVLVLNPDTEVTEEALVSLLAALKQHDAAIAGPALKLENDSKTEEVAWIVGAVMLFDKSKMDELGYFDEQFFLYREDVDICKRARDAGKKVIHCKGVSMPHVGAGSTPRSKEILQFIHYHKGRSYALYAKKHALGRSALEDYISKNRRRMVFALATGGLARYRRAKAKLRGVYSAL